MSRRILEEIFAARRKRVAEAQTHITLDELKARAHEAPPVRDFAGALSKPGFAVIAEVKKASPSKGVLSSEFDPEVLACAYTEGGASAISVVTEPDYFQGELSWLGDLRQTCPLPLLRKDFIFSPYQVWEARAAGADAILLILAMLPDADIAALMVEAKLAGMNCLLEVHDEAEAHRAAQFEPTLVGVNNRDLQTFEVHLETSERLAQHLPSGALKVSESGIFTHQDCTRLASAGYRAFLVGEALVKDGDPAARLRALKGNGPATH